MIIGHDQILGYSVILLSLSLLYFPVQQGFAIISTPAELTEDELNELYKLKQIDNAEKTRDNFFTKTQHKNPYFDWSTIFVPSFAKNSTDKLDEKEILQLIRDEQKSLAEKKLNELMFGKAISNPVDDQSAESNTTKGFELDGQTGFLKRTSNDFQDYLMSQMALMENLRDNHLNVNLKKNPYQNDTSVKEMKTKEYAEVFHNTFSDRRTTEFKNSIVEQALLAEEIRNTLPEFKETGNPYFEKNIEPLDDTNPVTVDDENLELSFDITQLEFKNAKRASEEFEMAKTTQNEIAQKTLNNMLLLSHLPEEDVATNSTNENKKQKNFERGELVFELLFKNKELDKAEKKLMEILGYKDIHNFESSEHKSSFSLIFK